MLEIIGLGPKFSKYNNLIGGLQKTYKNSDYSKIEFGQRTKTSQKIMIWYGEMHGKKDKIIKHHDFYSDDQLCGYICGLIDGSIEKECEL